MKTFETMLLITGLIVSAAALRAYFVGRGVCPQIVGFPLRGVSRRFSQMKPQIFAEGVGFGFSS